MQRLTARGDDGIKVYRCTTAEICSVAPTAKVLNLSVIAMAKALAQFVIFAKLGGQKTVTHLKSLIDHD